MKHKVLLFKMQSGSVVLLDGNYIFTLQLLLLHKCVIFEEFSLVIVDQRKGGKGTSRLIECRKTVEIETKKYYDCILV